MGFVVTAPGENVEPVCERFARVGITASAIGTVDTSRELRIRYRENDASVFDFSRNGIMRLFSGPACR